MSEVLKRNACGGFGTSRFLPVHLPVQENQRDPPSAIIKPPPSMGVQDYTSFDFTPKSRALMEHRSLHVLLSHLTGESLPPRPGCTPDSGVR